MTEAQPDAELSTKAREYLEAAGVQGISIDGGGESWRVSIGWHEHERFVVAFSERNPTTPNDPVYLAEQALATLIRNEGPCPFHVEPERNADALAPEAEAVQEQNDERSGDSVVDLAADSADGPSDLGDGGAPVVGDDDGTGEASLAGLDVLDAGDERSEPDLEPIDADFTEAPALEPPPVEPEPEPEPPNESVAIFGDNLDMLRVYKIGAVATRAMEIADAIRARADEQPGEFTDLQAYVITHLDKATGLFNGANQGDFDRYVILSNVRAAIVDLNRLRDEKTEVIRNGDREAVEAFDTEADWPA